MDNFDLKKYLAEGRLLKEEVDVNKILSDGGYDIIDDEELLMTVKSRLKGNSNIDAKKLNLLVMKIEDEEGGNIDFSEGKLSEMAYERDSVEDIVKRIKPILANHPQLKTLEDPDQYLIDFVTKRKKFLNKNEAPIDKDKFTYNVGTTPYDEYINLQFNKYVYSTLAEDDVFRNKKGSFRNQYSAGNASDIYDDFEVYYERWEDEFARGIDGREMFDFDDEDVWNRTNTPGDRVTSHSWEIGYEEEDDYYEPIINNMLNYLKKNKIYKYKNDDGIDAEFTLDDRGNSVDMVIYYTADDVKGSNR